MAAVCGSQSILGTLTSEEALQAHEPGDAIAPSRTAKDVGQSRTAVGLTTAHKLLADALAQASVLQLPRARAASTLDPIIIAAARDQESFAQPCHLVLAAHLFDSGIPLGGTSERMPSDFFNTSRCSKSLAFSARKRRISASSSATLRPGWNSLLDALDARSSWAQR